MSIIGGYIQKKKYLLILIKNLLITFQKNQNLSKNNKGVFEVRSTSFIL